MASGNLLKSWSTTQATIALSSAEAELYALVKGAAQGLGMVSMAEDLGYEMGVMVHTDSSAAVGITARKGLGKLRHIQTQFLWVQDKVRSGNLVVQKVAGEENVADALTNGGGGALRQLDVRWQAQCGVGAEAKASLRRAEGLGAHVGRLAVAV